MTSTVLIMILFKVLDIQDDEIMQRKIKRQKADINSRQKNFYKIYNFTFLIPFYILQMKMKYIIIQIFIQKSKMIWKFLMVGSSKKINYLTLFLLICICLFILDGF